MRDIQKMCRICLSQGSRNIFENSSISNMLARDDLSRICEKLRYVTMLKVSPNENLPQQICDLCIVQLNVSYNFKRLALKNDFQIRNYMIENGISLTKEDDHLETTTTALEIHQIHHNVIRTNRFRSIVGPEIRRNSTQSSVSGTSTMIINGQNDTNGNTGNNNFVTPRPMVRPIQIKTEPVDEDEPKETSPVTSTSSPSSSSEPASIVTVHSSNASSVTRRPPMIVINGIVNNDSFSKTPKAAPASVKIGRPRKNDVKTPEKPKEISRMSRTIKKNIDMQNVRKLRAVVRQPETVNRAAETVKKRVAVKPPPPPKPQKQKENKISKPKPKVTVVKSKKIEKKVTKPARNQPTRGKPKPPTKNIKNNKTVNKNVNTKKQPQKGKGRS